MKKLKEKIENNPVLFYLITFSAGVGIGFTIIIGYFNYNSNFTSTDLVNKNYVKIIDYQIIKDKYMFLTDSITTIKNNEIQNIQSEKTIIINKPKGQIKIKQ